MEKILDSLIDRQFTYKDKIIIIKKWKKISYSYVIITDRQTYNFYESEISGFVDQLKTTPINPDRNTFKNIKMELELEQKNKTISLEKNEDGDLKQILLNTIKKVQSDKAYIGQANAICNVVSQMINIKKLELQMEKK